MRKTTMMDIANKVGVSKATVSMVLSKKDGSISEETKEKIWAAAEDMGYIKNSVATSLSTRKTGTIGIILPDILNPFFSEIARAIEDTASELDYNVIFCNSDNNIDKEEKYVKLLISKLVDGVIFAAGGKSDKNLSYLINNNVPFVLVDRYIEGYEDAYGVYCNNKEGVIKGVKYLYDKGNKRIAFVMGPQKIQVSLQRLNGYKEAMKQYGLYDPSWVFETRLTLDGGMKATEELLNNLKDVDAILYSNDMMALGGIKYLLRKGYNVPKDIRVMGFDNITLTEFTEPELTTIAQPIYEMGQSACKLLTSVINGKVEQEQIYFEPKLVIRGTA
ncbi:transcriptional regulator, LacI family [Clostridium amylolyticum]|uniref:Transcriptional regulator, LacI family n=1 Tax=Clostridium amylolyticum TaxID=1121298 RepID=A0A1M6FBR3_9CLOT|nr:LacI family DNA-binding transcriptional regulator [Clostridium amylolyticum]SHI95091.1 transcriptional regulator, LacI family [Clostridium amylolyticum]